MCSVLTDLDWQVVLHYVSPSEMTSLRWLVPPKVTVLKQRTPFPFTLLH